MALVDYIDYEEKRIYLGIDSVGVILDTMDIYREARTLRREDTQTPYPHRGYFPMIIQGGNIRKTPATLTAPYVQLLYGCRIVPYDQDQNLKVIRDTFTDDGLEGAACFDRNGLTSSIDIDYIVDQIEIREVFIAGGTVWTEEEKNQTVSYSKKASDNAEQANLKIN
jgi:hypothetical protein